MSKPTSRGLVGLGAELLEVPVATRPGTMIAFLRVPVDVRIELIQRTR